MELREMEALLRKQDSIALLIRTEKDALARLADLIGDISPPPLSQEAHRGSGVGDPVGNEVLRRDGILAEMERYKSGILRMSNETALVNRLMLETLNKDERDVLVLRGVKGYPWTAVSMKAAISRARCFRLYNTGVGKLCMAWEKARDKNGRG